jgi:RNA polymerase sigma-70 factor (ECF subfamily)
MASFKHLNDNDLLSFIKEGDHAAFTEIYERYWKLLFRTAHHILQDREAAQDVIQNIFVSLWHRKETVQIGNLKAWLQQATRFAVFTAIREKKHDESFYERLASVTAEIITDNPLLFKEQQQLLKQLIDSLPEDCREAFRLSREENMTYKQIAALLGISEKTVEKRLSKSLAHIRTGLSVSMCIAVISVVNH